MFQTPQQTIGASSTTLPFSASACETAIPAAQPTVEHGTIDVDVGGIADDAEESIGADEAFVEDALTKEKDFVEIDITTTEAERFDLNLRQSAPARRQQLAENLVRAVELNGNNDFSAAWEMYKDIFDREFIAKACRMVSAPLPAPARKSIHDINNALADRIWRSAAGLDSENTPFGYADELKEYDAAKKKRADTIAAKLTQKTRLGTVSTNTTIDSAARAMRAASSVGRNTADDGDADSNLPAVGGAAAATDAIVVAADQGDDVDDTRQDCDVRYVAFIDNMSIVMDSEHNVEHGEHADTAADAHITVQAGLEFWRQHAEVQKRTTSKTQQNDSDMLVDRLHADRLLASRMRRVKNVAQLPPEHRCEYCGQYIGLRPDHEQKGHRERCAKNAQRDQ